MRRILYTVAASAALCVAAPSMGLARNGHHHKHHHHAHVRHETFKAQRHDTSGSSRSSSGTSSEPTAGTVATFANNIPRITLTNGSTVSGAVKTEVTCENPEMQNADNDADDNGAGDEQGDAVFHHSDGGGENGDDRGDDNSNDQTCTIMPGMAVRQAELTINGTGAIWNEIELVSSTTSTSSQS
ncbi:MAG: hypothetical protein ACJ780_24810 [Solirubrobacteraceae bacterium]